MPGSQNCFFLYKGMKLYQGIPGSEKKPEYSFKRPWTTFGITYIIKHNQLRNRKKEYIMTNTFAISWNEFNSKDQLVTKAREFKSAKARDSFLEKQMAKDNFNDVLALSYPDGMAPEPEDAPVIVPEVSPDELVDDTPDAPEKDLTAPVIEGKVTRRSMIKTAAKLLAGMAYELETIFDWKLATDRILTTDLGVIIPDEKKYRALRRAIRREALTLIGDPVISDRLKLK